eukprot:6869558-Prorocentrum_lima.AAC.1
MTSSLVGSEMCIRDRFCPQQTTSKCSHWNDPVGVASVIPQPLTVYAPSSTDLGTFTSCPCE